MYEGRQEWRQPCTGRGCLSALAGRQGSNTAPTVAAVRGILCGGANQRAKASPRDSEERDPNLSAPRRVPAALVDTAIACVARAARISAERLGRQCPDGAGAGATTHLGGESRDDQLTVSGERSGHGASVGHPGGRSSRSLRAPQGL